MGIDPEKIIIEKDTCTPVFIAGLFTIARTWKQTQLLINRRIDKEALIQRYRLDSVLMRWMNLLYRVK